MKKVIASALALAFLVSVSGCISKGEHDKVLKQKASIEEKYTQLTKENVRLKGQVSTLEKVKGEFTRITQENAQLKTENSTLQKEKEDLTQQLKQAKI